MKFLGIEIRWVGFEKRVKKESWQSLAQKGDRIAAIKAFREHDGGNKPNFLLALNQVDEYMKKHNITPLA